MKPIGSAIVAGSSAFLLELMFVFYRVSDIGHGLSEFTRTLLIAILFIASFPISAIFAAFDYAGSHLYHNMTSPIAIVVGLTGPVFWGSMAYLIHRHFRK